MVAVRYPWPTDQEVEATPQRATEPDARPKRRGRRPVSADRSQAPTTPDWLYHHLTVSGPADSVASFTQGALGSGVIPWRLDFAALEEDIFLRAAAQPTGRRSLSVQGCRILARQFREAVEAHQARAIAQTGQSLACPLDLHRLLPVPHAILQLGPTDPAALAWLARHWGVTDRLRQVCIRPGAKAGRRLRTGDAVAGYGFFTRGETPHPAIEKLVALWPGLRLVLAPRPAT